ARQTAGARSDGGFVARQHEGSGGFRRNGTREQVTLAVFTPEHREMIEVRLRFYALGYDVEAQIVGQVHDGADDLGRFALRAHLTHERAIDLQCIEREPVHVAQRRVTCPEVVDG